MNKVSAKDVSESLCKVLVSEHYQEATSKVSCGILKKIVFSQTFDDKKIVISWNLKLEQEELGFGLLEIGVSKSFGKWIKPMVKGPNARTIRLKLA